MHECNQYNHPPFALKQHLSEFLNFFVALFLFTDFKAIFSMPLSNVQHSPMWHLRMHKYDVVLNLVLNEKKSIYEFSLLAFIGEYESLKRLC